MIFNLLTLIISTISMAVGLAHLITLTAPTNTDKVSLRSQASSPTARTPN